VRVSSSIIIIVGIDICPIIITDLLSARACTSTAGGARTSPCTRNTAPGGFAKQRISDCLPHSSLRDVGLRTHSIFRSYSTAATAIRSFVTVAVTIQLCAASREIPRDSI
jgi:hypothetical protein